MTRAAWLLALPAAGLVALAGCTVNPATGRQSFTGFMSPAAEVEVGRQHHGEVLEELGGAYEDPELARYVDSIGQFLASTAERKDLRYTFTVLDSPEVNALALPGGYVYVTRGLLALAGSEAELAGVIAHEIGHVAARHAAERYSRGVLANVGLAGIGIATGSPALSQALGAGASIYLQSYSRDQEYEADLLGVRYLARAGYEPKAMSSLLAKLLAHDRLEAAIAGEPTETYGLLSSHPRTADRVERAIQAAPPVAHPLVERLTYLAKLDGLVYGDSPDEGYVRGTAFVHPVLGFTFEVPQGFRLTNGPRRVIAKGPQDAVIAFDRARQANARNMVQYLAAEWGRGLDLEGVEALDVNGFDAATGFATVADASGRLDVRLVAIRFDDAIYRFLFATPPALTPALSLPLRQTTYSFRRLRPGDPVPEPQRIRVVAAGPGDTVETLSRDMPFEDFREERFRVLNGLAPEDRLRLGDTVKVVVE